MPTSMTTTPSRTMSAFTNRGEPIAAALVPCSADGRRPSLLGQDWVPDEPEEETAPDEELPNGGEDDD